MNDDERAALRLQVLQLLIGRGTARGTMIEQLPELDRIVRWVLLGEVPDPAPAADLAASRIPGAATAA